MNKKKLFALSIILAIALAVSSTGMGISFRQVIAAPLSPSTGVKVYLPRITNHSGLEIGLLVPLTGPVASFGASVQNGAQMAVDEWNARGGLFGMHIALAPADGQCNASVASAAATRLIEQNGVHYIIGEVCSGASIPVSEIAQAGGVVMISPISTNPQVTINPDGSVKPYVFRACFIDPYQAEAMAMFARHQGLGKAFYLSQPGNSYSIGMASSFAAKFTGLQGSIVGHEDYPNADPLKTLPAIMDEVKASGADLLYLPYFNDDVKTIGSAVKAKGITAVMLGSDAWESPSLDLAAVEGGFYTTHFNVQNTDAVIHTWIQKFHALYTHDPDSLAALGYDSANLLLTSIQNAKQDNPALVKDQMASLVFQGVTGQITFDQFHNPQKSAVIMHIHNGQLTFYSMYP